MQHNDIINRIIVFLSVLSVYQTGVLWFNQTLSQTVTEIAVNSTAFWNRSSDGNVLLATKYAIGQGDSFFSLYYPDETGQSLFLEETNSLLNEILLDKNIDFSDEPIFWKEILSKPSVTMQYDFLITGEDYLKQYSNLKNSQLPKDFDYITITPGELLGDVTSAYFINSITNETVCYSTTKSISAPSFYDNINCGSEDIVYLSTSERTYSPLITRNIFLPQLSNMPYDYQPLLEFSVFGSAEFVNQSVLENVLKGFFTNFSINWDVTDIDSNNNFMYSDNETIAKYNPNEEILEYFNYSSYGNTNDTLGILEGYQLSCNFLRNDISLNTDIYLSNIIHNDGANTFCFNYSVNNIPIILSGNVRETINGYYPIEITIKNGIVTKYRRYMKNYSLAPEKTSTLTIPFIDALDNMLSEYNSTDNNISNVFNVHLGYYIENSQPSDLKWFINVDDDLFISNLENNSEYNSEYNSIELIGDTDLVIEHNFVDYN